MSRLGFLGLNEMSESMIRAIYRTVTEVQIFLYPSDSSHIQKLARVYPCWTLNDCQSVSDESEIIFISLTLIDLTDVSKSLNLHSTHTVVSLNPDISVQQLRLFFPRKDCIRMIIEQEENSKPVVVISGRSKRLEHLLYEAGFLYRTSEIQSNLNS